MYQAMVVVDNDPDSWGAGGTLRDPANAAYCPAEEKRPTPLSAMRRKEFKRAENGASQGRSPGATHRSNGHSWTHKYKVAPICFPSSLGLGG